MADEQPQTHPELTPVEPAQEQEHVIQDNSNTDEHEDAISEAEELHLSHEQRHVANPYLWIFSAEASLQALHWFNFFMNIVHQGYTIVSKVSKGVLRSMQEQTYVFFLNTAFPYRVQDLTLQGPGVPQIEWYYNADKKLFIAGNMYETSNDYFPRHLPYLSGELRYEDLVLHDLSDFINEVRWVGNGSLPAAKYLLAAWSLQSGIILDQNERKLSLHCIMETGQETNVSFQA